MQAAVDLSGRPYLVHNEPDGAPPTIGSDYATTLTRHVFESFTYHAAIALHVTVHGGRDWHHITEAQYKAVARALRAAVELDPRVSRRAVHEGRALSTPCARRSRRRARLRFGQPALGPARPRAGRGRRHRDRRPRGGRRRPTGWSCPASARSPRAWPGLRRGGRRAMIVPTGWPAGAGARHLRRHAGAVRGRGRARGRVGRAGRAARARRARCARRCCRTWAGTPSRPPDGSTLVRRVGRRHAVLLRPLLRRARAPTSLGHAPAEHGEPFVAAVERGPVSATQFHPEKSGDAGAALLENWLATV